MPPFNNFYLIHIVSAVDSGCTTPSELALKNPKSHMMSSVLYPFTETIFYRQGDSESERLNKREKENKQDKGSDTKG